MLWPSAIDLFLGFCITAKATEGCVQRHEKCDKPPRNCNLDPEEALHSYKTVEDFDRCAPYLLSKVARDYSLACAGRGITCRENKLAFGRLRILPRMLRDVSNTDTCVTLLGDEVGLPIGAAPVAFQKLTSKNGELDTVRAISDVGGVMILGSYASTKIEDVARAAPLTVKWMQSHMFENKEIILNLTRRAEAAGFKAIVLTVDTPVIGTTTVDDFDAQSLSENSPTKPVNIEGFGSTIPASNPRSTFEDIAWLKRNTWLPIVACGILTVEDAMEAVRHGASAILVSNHGGRQLDSAPASIDVLPKIADALKTSFPSVEVYMDGGIRNGWDVFKAFACGARAVFIGRPISWGLAAGGQKGFAKVLDILKKELKQTMMLAGTPNISSIERKMVVQDMKIILTSDSDDEK